MKIPVSLFARCMFSVLLGMYLGADCLAHLAAEQHFSVGGTDQFLKFPICCEAILQESTKSWAWMMWHYRTAVKIPKCSLLLSTCFEL